MPLKPTVLPQPFNTNVSSSGFLNPSYPHSYTPAALPSTAENSFIGDCVKRVCTGDCWEQGATLQAQLQGGTQAWAREGQGKELLLQEGRVGESWAEIREQRHSHEKGHILKAREGMRESSQRLLLAQAQGSVDRCTLSPQRHGWPC